MRRIDTSRGPHRRPAVPSMVGMCVLVLAVVGCGEPVGLDDAAGGSSGRQSEHGAELSYPASLTYEYTSSDGRAATMEWDLEAPDAWTFRRRLPDGSVSLCERLTRGELVQFEDGRECDTIESIRWPSEPSNDGEIVGPSVSPLSPFSIALVRDLGTVITTTQDHNGRAVELLAWEDCRTRPCDLMEVVVAEGQPVPTKAVLVEDGIIRTWTLVDAKDGAETFITVDQLDEVPTSR